MVNSQRNINIIKTVKLSERSLAILYHAKQNPKNIKDSHHLVTEALKDQYCSTIPLKDCIHHVLSVFFELSKETRFHIFPSDNVEFIKELITYPFKSRQFDKDFNLTLSLNFETLSNDYLDYLLSRICLTNIGWCEQYQNYKEEQNAKQ